MSDQEIRKGLYGVVADYTAISKVIPETNSLTYRSYAVQDLAVHCTLEEIAYLLWEGELPTEEQIAERSKQSRAMRYIDVGLMGLIDSLPKDCHPMDVVRTAVSYLGTKDPEKFTRDVAHIKDVGLRLLAQLPTVVAYDMRRREGKEFIAPDKTLSLSENFLNMCFGDDPDSVAHNADDIKTFEISMVLYAEHSFNASTFTARTITSTLSDPYSAITGAIGALKGPLHGGANEAVMDHMLEIGEPEKAEQYLLDKLNKKELVMGFGHRVYKNGDSRVSTMEAAFKNTASRHGGEKWVEMYDIMVKTMYENTSINIRPNLDFPSGPTYYLMGFPVDFFTPLFVIARVTGWTAHIMEQYSNNSLIRPLSAYNGKEQRELPQEYLER